MKSLAVIGLAGPDTFTGVSRLHPPSIPASARGSTPPRLRSALPPPEARLGATNAQGTKGDLPLTTVPSTVLRTTPTPGAACLGRASYRCPGPDGTGAPADVPHRHHLHDFRHRSPAIALLVLARPAA